MATFNKFDSIHEALPEAIHDLGSDTLKLLLTNSAPSVSDTQKSDLTEIGAGNGYTAGGATITITSSSQTGGTYKLIGNDVVWSASGGSIGPFRYIVLYNDTASNDELIGWWDYGSALTLNDGEDFTVDFSATNGILQVV